MILPHSREIHVYKVSCINVISICRGNVIIKISGHFFYNNRPHVGGVKIGPNFPPKSGSPAWILSFLDRENYFRVCGRLFQLLHYAAASSMRGGRNRSPSIGEFSRLVSAGKVLGRGRGEGCCFRGVHASVVRGGQKVQKNPP